MRIGIMTYWTSDDNYGQQLQCYALQKYLISQGHDAFLIRYTGGNTISLLRKIKNNLSISKILYRFTREHKLEKKRALYENKLRQINKEKNVERRFEEFRKNNLQMSEKIYTSIEELRNDSPVADVYICGSDQVWNNPLYSKNTAAWFLSFGDKHVKRISYAASIGRELEKEELDRFKALLDGFNAISVREISSLDLCMQLGLKSVQIVTDPTLLLPANDYHQLADTFLLPSSESPYMFMYLINIFSEKEIYWDMVRAYLNDRELALRVVCSSGYIQSREIVPSVSNIPASIPEWLALIKNSACVVTTSFHGIVFCIKMHRPFLAVLLTNTYSGGNDRLTSLLNALDLGSCIFNPLLSFDKQMEQEIDWYKVDTLLREMNELSEAFLCENLLIAQNDKVLNNERK